MAENNEPSLLLSVWQKEKGNIEGSIGSFLDDPLKWVAGELQKVVNVSPDRLFNSRVKTLAEIITFINNNKNLLMPKEYTTMILAKEMILARENKDR